MTRIFDALKKARAPHEAGTALPPAPPPAPLASPIHAVMNRGSAPAASARMPLERAEPVPIGAIAPMDDTVIRELSTLRVILESTIADRAPRSIMLASSQPGEGTSTVTLQFAQALMQEAGQRVLIVDARTRRRTPLYESAARAIRAGEGRGRAVMDLLPLADRTQRGASLPVLAIRDLIEVSGSGYDWILVDAPPLLESPDTAPLAAQMDAVVLVIQAGRTKRPVLVRAMDLLRRSGANVVGTVLNRRRLEIPDFIYRRI